LDSHAGTGEPDLETLLAAERVARTSARSLITDRQPI
jgi:hypothetical protein